MLTLKARTCRSRALHEEQRRVQFEKAGANVAHAHTDAPLTNDVTHKRQQVGLHDSGRSFLRHAQVSHDTRRGGHAL